MTLSYNVGLTTGSLVAYLLDSLLGPPITFNGCVKPTVSGASSWGTSATYTTFLATAASTGIPTTPSPTTVVLTSTILSAVVNTTGSELLTLPTFANVTATITSSLLGTTASLPEH